MSRMMITFPVLMLAGKIDWNEDTLFIGRLALSSVVLSTLIAYFFLYQRVNQKKDKTKIFVPPPATPGLAGPTPGKGPPRETTYHEYECELVRQGANQAVMSAVISGGIHFYWGVNPPLVLQCIFIPLGVYDNLVFKKYILSDKKKNIYDETFSKPDEAVAAFGDSKQKPEARMEAAILATWDSGKEADFQPLLQLVKQFKKKNLVKVQTKGDGWSCLMVACGLVDKQEEVATLLRLGAPLNPQDHDGWSCLHWCAYHGRGGAAEVVLAQAQKDMPKQLLKQFLLRTSKEGDTAEQVAAREGSTAVEALIKQAVSQLCVSKEGVAASGEASNEEPPQFVDVD